MCTIFYTVKPDSALNSLWFVTTKVYVVSLFGEVSFRCKSLIAATLNTQRELKKDFNPTVEIPSFEVRFRTPVATDFRPARDRLRKRPYRPGILKSLNQAFGTLTSSPIR